MPWNGSGVFSRVYSWAADRDAGLDILADRMDTDTDDIAQGLMHCLTVNGETVPVANLPMANYRHTGASAGVAATDYVTVGQLQNGGGGLGSGFLPLSGGTISGNLTVTGTLTAALLDVNGNINASGAIATNGTVEGAFLYSSGNLQVAGGAVIGGYGINYSNYYPGHNIALGWDGSNLDAFIDNGNFGPLVLANRIGNLSASGTITAGALNVGAGTVTCGNINASGTVTAGLLGSLSDCIVDRNCDVTGNINCGGTVGAPTLVISGGGTISGSLSVGGTVTAGALSAGVGTVTCGNLNASGTVNAGAVICANVCTVNSNLNVQGNIATDGAGYQPGGGPWQALSDIRLKRAVEDYHGGLAEIVRLRPISYAYNGLGGAPDDGRRFVGLVADEVREFMPEMVGSRRGKLAPEDAEETDILTMNAGPLTYALVNAVRELSLRLEALEAAAAAAAG